MGKRSNIHQRIVAERDARQKRLPEEIRANIQVFQETAFALPTVESVLEGLRNLMPDAEFDARDSSIMANYRKMIENQIEYLFRQPDFHFDPNRLGCKTPAEVAKLLTELATNVGYGKYSTRDLREKASGLEGVFNGELFELYVTNHEILMSQMQTRAEGLVDDLNSEMAKRGGVLNNFVGETISLSGQFGVPKVATNVELLMPDGWKKYVDRAFISLFEPAKGSLPASVDTTLSGAGEDIAADVSNLEIKRSGAAQGSRGLGPQIGQEQVRVEVAIKIRFTLKGEATSREYSVRNFIDPPMGVQRTGVTTSKSGVYSGNQQGDLNSSDFRVAFTRAGGYLQDYIRVGLVVDTEYLTRFTRILFGDLQTFRTKK